jgi:sugar lactone lactonase YvrE
MHHFIFRRGEAIVAESLVHSDGAMWWCDIPAGIIHRSGIDDPLDGSADTTIALPAPVASFHPAQSGLVASLGDRVVLTDPTGTVVSTLASIDHADTTMRLNEGKVDLAGRWVTASMCSKPGAHDAAFYSIDAGGNVRIIADGLGVGNGLEWSLDGSRIYFTDTDAQTIYTGRYSDDGAVTDVDVFHEGASNDGLTIDTDGTFWTTVFGAGRVLHLDASGIEIESVELPVPNLTSIAFRGSTLYVASARENLDADQLMAAPLSGSIFAIETTTTGRSPRTFPG